MKMRVLALSSLLGLTLAVATPALAATVTNGHEAPPAYPITISSTLSVSTQHPLFNETITVSGQNFQASTTVELDLVKQSDETSFSSAVHTVAAQSYALGTATTDASGAFTLKVTMPGASAGAGTYLVRGYTHYNGPDVPTQTVYLTSGSSGTGGTTTGTGTGSGGTALTGVDIAALVAAALVLIGSGALLASRGRNRRSVKA